MDCVNLLKSFPHTLRSQKRCRYWERASESFDGSKKKNVSSQRNMCWCDGSRGVLANSAHGAEEREEADERASRVYQICNFLEDFCIRAGKSV